ncbi:MAG: hypothetical protein AB7K04_07185 [Pseudorhodoplanes sp.]
MRTMVMVAILGLAGVTALFSARDAQHGRGYHVYLLDAGYNLDMSSSQRHNPPRLK